MTMIECSINGVEWSGVAEMSLRDSRLDNSLCAATSGVLNASGGQWRNADLLQAGRVTGTRRNDNSTLACRRMR